MGKRSGGDDGIRKNKKARESTNLMVLGKGTNKLIIHKEDYKTIGNILKNLNISNCLELTQNGATTINPHLLHDMIEVAEDDDERRVARLEVFNCNGSLPVCIGKLQNLKYLNLFSTQFYGRPTQYLLAIPEEIGNLTNLITLNLDGSGIASLPSGIGRLENLKDLKICRTKNLATLPEEIGNLTNLITLSLCASGVASLPSGIGGLESLKDLNLSFTRNLVTLPEEIGNLTNLTTLNLCGSRIASLPSGIGGLKSLEDLQLSYTDNLVTLPEEIGNLRNLDRLILYRSSIPSLPISIRNKLGYTLACRTARAQKPCFRTTSKGHVQDTVVLWPLVLRNARRAFEFDSDNSVFIGYHCRDYSIGEHDAVYTILMDNIESFLRLLKNRH